MAEQADGRDRVSGVSSGDGASKPRKVDVGQPPFRAAVTSRLAKAYGIEDTSELDLLPDDPPDELWWELSGWAWYEKQFGKLE